MTYNAEPLPSELHATASRAVDDAQNELAAIPAAARYRADVKRYGTPENALRAVAIRANDVKALLEATKAAMGADGGEHGTPTE